VRDDREGTPFQDGLRAVAVPGGDCRCAHFNSGNRRRASAPSSGADGRR
jgi:hypothetical protein